MSTSDDPINYSVIAQSLCALHSLSTSHNESFSESCCESQEKAQIPTAKSGDVVLFIFGDDQQIIHFKKGCNFGTEIIPLLKPKMESNNDVLTLIDYGGVYDNVGGGRHGVPYMQSSDVPKIAFDNSVIFSFVPTNAKWNELSDMSRIAEAAGFIAMIIIADKHGKYGKAAVLDSIVSAFDHKNNKSVDVTYFEDTGKILDEIRSASIRRMWVMPSVDSEHRDNTPTCDHTAIEIEQFVAMATGN